MSQWRDALHDSAFDSAFEEGNFQGARGWKGDEIKRYKGHDADDSGWDFVHVKTTEEDNCPEGTPLTPRLDAVEHEFTGRRPEPFQVPAFGKLSCLTKFTMCGKFSGFAPIFLSSPALENVFSQALTFSDDMGDDTGPPVFISIQVDWRNLGTVFHLSNCGAMKHVFLRNQNKSSVTHVLPELWKHAPSLVSLTLSGVRLGEDAGGSDTYAHEKFVISADSLPAVFPDVFRMSLEGAILDFGAVFAKNRFPNLTQLWLPGCEFVGSKASFLQAVKENIPEVKQLIFSNSKGDGFAELAEIYAALNTHPALDQFDNSQEADTDTPPEFTANLEKNESELTEGVKPRMLAMHPEPREADAGES